MGGQIGARSLVVRACGVFAPRRTGQSANIGRPMTRDNAERAFNEEDNKVNHLVCGLRETQSFSSQSLSLSSKESWTISAHLETHKKRSLAKR